MATKKKRPNWIPVVTGVIKRGDFYLLGQRPENGSMAGVWEFPGGKIEYGESPEEALARELREELGVEAEIGSLKLSTTHSYGDTGILLLFFEIKYWKGEVKPVHHHEIKWVSRADLMQENLPEANKKVLDKILELFG
jgi:8-oxo-dGTP diphosphatase